MEQQQDELDLYDLLEIDAEFRPPTHYQLLGVNDFETDLEVIAAAAKERGVYLHRIAAGPHRKAVQQLLGEVAVARRTLLNQQSKDAYDQQLLIDSEEYEQQHAGGIQIATDPDAGTEESKEPAQDTDRAHARRRRKKSTWDEYKLHAASASILLAIVGVVWFVNRGGGERRAAKAGAAKTTSTVRSPEKISSPAKRAATQRTANIQPAAGRPRPAAPRRSTPSLAPDFDVQAFLSKDAPGMSKPNEAEQVAAKPNTNAVSVAMKLPADWEPKIKVVDDFSSQNLAGTYQFDDKKTACKIENGHVVIQTAKASKYGTLRHQKLKLKAGQAIALDTNLTPKSEHGVQIGLAVGPARIALGVVKGQLQVRAKNQGESKSPMKSLGNLKASSSPTTLIVMRNKDNPKLLQWLARSADGDLSGRIQVDSLPAQVPVVIFFTAPEKSTKTPIWFDNLRAGNFANPPEWKPSEVLKL